MSPIGSPPDPPVVRYIHFFYFDSMALILDQDYLEITVKARRFDRDWKIHQLTVYNPKTRETLHLA